MNWRGLATDGKFIVGCLVLLGMLALVTAYSVVRSASVRIGLVLAVLLVPTLLYSGDLLLVVFSPYLAISGTWKVLFGRGGGQFYGDGGLFITAACWWDVLALVLLGRECWLLRKRKQAAQ